MDTYRCGHTITPENTYTKKSGRQTGKTSCATCVKERQRRYNARRRAGQDTSRKVRTHCQRGHELTEANTMIVRGRRPGGTIEVSRRCRVCEAAKRERTREYMRDYLLRTRYGLTRTEFDRMVEDQGGLCVICATRVAIAVDHDHETGVVRGILCKGCNVAIGVIGDDKATMARAMAYLTREGI